MEGGGRQQRPSCRRSALISLDSTHVCGSERRGIPGDRCTGRLPGDRKLRLRSHTAAGRKARRDQEDRLRMTEQRIVMLQLHQELLVRKKKTTLFLRTVLTLRSVVTSSAATRPRHSVTGAVVLTVAFELTVGSKHACRTF